MDHGFVSSAAWWRKATLALGLAGVLAVSVALPAVAAVESESVLKEENGFIRHNFLEVGVHPNGAFGSTVSAPEGWHPADLNRESPNNSGQFAATIGFVSDRNRDGWGSEPINDEGDFFMPGGPYEAWGLQVGSSAAAWNYPASFVSEVGQTTNIPGAILSATEGQPKVTWESTGDVNGVLVSQDYRLPANGIQTLIMDVRLTNTTGTEQVVYYARSVDPDNCVDQLADYTCEDQDTGGYGNFTKIAAQAQDGDILNGSVMSAVVATQGDQSALYLWSTGKQSAVLAGTGPGWLLPWGHFCKAPPSLSALYDANRDKTSASPLSLDCPTGFQSKGAYYNAFNEEVFTDEIMYLVIKETIPAGETANITLAYSMSNAAFLATDLSLKPLVVQAGSRIASAGQTPRVDFTTDAAAAWDSEPSCDVFAEDDTDFAQPLRSALAVGTYVTHCTGGEAPGFDLFYADGTLTVSPVTPNLTLSGSAFVTVGGEVTFTGSGDRACARDLSYSLSPNPVTGSGSLTLNGSTASTVGWLPGVYTVTVASSAQGACKAASNSLSTLTVVAAGNRLLPNTGVGADAGLVGLSVSAAFVGLAGTVLVRRRHA